MSSRENIFDLNNVDRIKALLKIKGYALSFFIGIGNNFYTLFSAIVDIPLSYIINDELTNVSHREKIRELLSVCALEKDEYIDKGISDMQDLFCNRADQIIGSLLLDFHVSAFSAFETWMCEAYDCIKPHFETKNSKKKKLIKLINKYNKQNSEETLDEIMSSCSNYVSSTEKIKFVLSKVKKGYPPYTTYEQDLVLIDFFSKKRNTVHNCGIHKGKDQEWEYKNKIYKLENNKGYFSENHAEDLVLWLDILTLYAYVFIYIMKNFEGVNK